MNFFFFYEFVLFFYVIHLFPFIFLTVIFFLFINLLLNIFNIINPFFNRLSNYKFTFALASLDASASAAIALWSIAGKTTSFISTRSTFTPH